MQPTELLWLTTDAHPGHHFIFSSYSILLLRIVSPPFLFHSILAPSAALTFFLSYYCTCLPLEEPRRLIVSAAALRRRTCTYYAVLHVLTY